MYFKRRNFRGGRIGARTSHHLKDLVGFHERKLLDRVDSDESQMLEGWSEVVGERLSAVTRAVSFKEGKLRIRVQSSVVYSLLVEWEQERLLEQIRQRFPKVKIKGLVFRVGVV